MSNKIESAVEERLATKRSKNFWQRQKKFNVIFSKFFLLFLIGNQQLLLIATAHSKSVEYLTDFPIFFFVILHMNFSGMFVSNHESN